MPQPATAGDAVADLHALLTAADEAKPYVLNLWRSDSQALCQHLSEGRIRPRPRRCAQRRIQDAQTPEQWAIQRKLIEGDVQEDVALYPALERIDVDRSFDQIRAAPPLRPIPLVVLSADRPWGPQMPSMIAEGKLSAEIPPDFGYVTDTAQKQAQEQLAELVPGAKHITNTNSGHEIHKEQPQLVIDSIREVVEAVRSGRRQPAR